jgi:hypothetical protein
MYQSTTDRPPPRPECVGCRGPFAISLGLSASFPNVPEIIERGMMMYDASHASDGNVQLTPCNAQRAPWLKSQMPNRTGRTVGHKITLREAFRTCVASLTSFHRCRSDRRSDRKS